MHLIERYATSCGVKIGKPYIYETFFPLPVERYITFQPFSKYNSKNYDYWQEVINYITPYLDQQDIRIVQIGQKNDIKFNGTIHLCGLTSISQSAYIIRNSLMHLSTDSFSAHVASGMGKKIVALYSNNNINNVKPYWTKEEDMILFNSNIENQKPSYSAEEQIKTINNLKPENIAEAVLKMLKIEYKNIPNTIYIGSDYTQNSFEIIPEEQFNTQNIPIENPIIRMDYVFNEKILEKILETRNGIIFTNKPIKKSLIEKYKSKIRQIIYILEEDNDPNFVAFLKSNSINYVLLSFLEDSTLNKFKINYLDYSLIIQKKHKNKEELPFQFSENLRYKSSRILFSSKGQHASRFDWINNTGDKVVDHPDFWKELDNFYIYSID